MNPDNKTINAAILLTILSIIYLLSHPDDKNLKISSTLSLLLTLRYCLQIFKHFGSFLSHTSKLRKSRIIYEETGQKTDRSTEGYASLNTLLLSGVISIIGAFCMGAVVCSCCDF